LDPDEFVFREEVAQMPNQVNSAILGRQQFQQELASLIVLHYYSGRQLQKWKEILLFLSQSRHDIDN
jgi:hypothetical protein